MFGRWPFCKTEGTCISSLRVYLVVIVISRLFNLVGKDRLYSIGYAEIELDYTRESVVHNTHRCIHSPVHRLSTPLLLLLLLLLLPLLLFLPLPSPFLKNRRSLPFSGLMSAAAAATNLDPSQRSIQDEDESVRIAVRALGDMRNSALLHSPPHLQSVSCAYLSHIFRPPFTHSHL